MKRKTPNRWRSATSSCAASVGSAAGASLIVLEPSAVESINHRGLGRTELDPLGAIELHFLIEFFGDDQRRFVDLFHLVELALKSEFAGERLFERPATPDRDRGLAFVAVPEMDIAQRVLHFLH